MTHLPVDPKQNENEGISPPALPSYPCHDPDEINLLEYLYVLVRNKGLIAGMTFAGMVIGLVAAFVKGPTWVAETVIAPRETESQRAPSLTGFGALGGLMASQLNLGGSASLDKIDLVLQTKKFNAEMIETYGLLPSIYRMDWPAEYREYYDTAQKKWRDDFVMPALVKIGSFVSKEYLNKEINKNNTMNVSVASGDSAFSYNLMNACIEYANTYIKETIQRDARENVAYLETQLVGISDPLLREKLQTLIAGEMEKMMVVSKEAFQVIDPLYLSKKFREKKLYPLVFGFGLFFLTTLAVVFGHAFGSAQKTDEDRKLIEGIKREVRFIRKR